ncbi:hypothetical protein [Sphingomonas sp. ID0503]
MPIDSAVPDASFSPVGTHATDAITASMTTPVMYEQDAAIGVVLFGL